MEFHFFSTKKLFFFYCKFQFFLQNWKCVTAALTDLISNVWLGLNLLFMKFDEFEMNETRSLHSIDLRGHDSLECQIKY